MRTILLITFIAGLHIQCLFSQERYYTDLADSARIDSIVNAELENPLNILIRKYDTVPNVLFKTPSVNSEEFDYLDFFYPVLIIIDKGKRETIDGTEGSWFRVYSELYGEKMTGWIFEHYVAGLKQDIRKNENLYNGSYYQLVASPCIECLTIRTSSKGCITKAFTAYLNDTLDFSLCWTFPGEIKKPDISGNTFMSDSALFSKGWFMKADFPLANKCSTFLLFPYDKNFLVYYKLNDGTDILDFVFVRVARKEVNLYAEPSLNSGVITKLSENAPFRVFGTAEAETVKGKTDHWYKVKYYGQDGWLFGNTVEVYQP